MKRSVSCHNPDHIRLWLQRVRGHLGVRLRVRPRPEDSHSDLSQILSILLGDIRRWHTDLLILSKVWCVCVHVEHAPCSFARCNASFDSLRLPPVMIIESTPARRERSSTWEKSSAGEELEQPG